ncbi:MAG TPA: hypothetical protein VK862_00860 [Afifellaceae bacterium]|nr:hypothetical protein [Afifellaceae bacterium]
MSSTKNLGRVARASWMAAFNSSCASRSPTTWSSLLAQAARLTTAIAAMAACLKDFTDRSLVWMAEGKHRLSKGP